MLENTGAMTRSRARTSVWRHRAIRPFPSLKGWTIVDDLVRGFALHEDRSRPPPPRVLLQVVLEHHEMEALEETLIDFEALIVCDLEDIGHRVPITGEGELRLLLCL